jgi:O-antigen ligase
MKAFLEDWRGSYVSLICGVGVLFAFSQAWIAPLFGFTLSELADSSIIRYVYYPFYLMGIYLMVVSFPRLLDSLWRSVLIVTLIVMCIASVTWSIAPDVTLRRCIALIMTAVCAYGLAARFSWKRLTEIIGFAFLISMILSYIYGAFFPHLGRMQELFVGAWRGVWIEKNNLGSVMSLGCVAAVAAAIHNPTRRYFWAGVAVGMIGLVLLSTSKTSLLATLIGLSVMGAVYFMRKGPMFAIIGFWLVSSTILVIILGLIIEPTLLFKLLGKDATLTGRTFIWQGISFVMQKRPLLGYGYGVVWTTEGPWTPLAWITDIAGFRAYHAHSCWYEVWLSLGMVGLVTWVLAYIDLTLKAFYRIFCGTGGYFALSFILMYLLSSLTESLALGWNELRWSLLMMVAAKISLPEDRDAVSADPVWRAIPAWRLGQRLRTQNRAPWLQE